MNVERTTGTNGTRSARRVSRRRFLQLGGVGVAGVALFGVAGCGGGSADEAGGGSASGTAINHDADTTRIEEPARRVVAISDEMVDLFAALEMEPAGLASSRIRADLGEPIREAYYVDIGDPVYVGEAESPSMERIAGLQPDLIIVGSFLEDDVYERASEIAPTLSYGDLSPGWWRGPLTDVGRATGREERAKGFVADYDALVAELRDRLAPMVKESPRLAVLYAPDASTTFVFDERGAPANPHAKLGFDLVAPPGVRIPKDGFAQVSSEVVGDLKADTVVVLRPTEDETPERLPVEDILNALEGPEAPRVLRQVIDPTRPSSSPVADRQAIEQAAEILLKSREGE